MRFKTYKTVPPAAVQAQYRLYEPLDTMNNNHEPAAKLTEFLLSDNGITDRELTEEMDALATENPDKFTVLMERFYQVVDIVEFNQGGDCSDKIWR